MKWLSIFFHLLFFHITSALEQELASTHLTTKDKIEVPKKLRGTKQSHRYLEEKCNDQFVVIELKTDVFGYETSWTISERESGAIVLSGTNYSDNAFYVEEYCLDSSTCYTFTIYDSFGDGLIDGFYNVYSKGTLILSGGAFDFSEQGSLSCETNPSKKPTLSPTTQPSLMPSSTLLPSITPTTQPTLPNINCNGYFVQIELQTDNYGFETSWEISDTESGAIVLQGTNYSDDAFYAEEYCLDSSTCYTFTIYDSFGDGICCSWGNGFYNVYSDETLILSGGAFGTSEQGSLPCETNPPSPSLEETCLAENLKLKAPVILKLSQKNYEQDKNYTRMDISGGNSPWVNQSCRIDMTWKNQSNFWYLEVDPLMNISGTCPVPGSMGSVIDNKNINDDSSACYLYNFRLLINNNLTEPGTIHYHGLTPPTNQDGVPLVTTPNIESKSIQYYNFQEIVYPGMYWMHSHWGFHEALGIAVPVIFQHDKNYLPSNVEDVVVQLEDGILYPKCNYSGYYLFKEECEHIDEDKWNQTLYFINNQEHALEISPAATTTKLRIRFLNSGVQDYWTISGLNFEILALDANDVKRGVTVENFFLGIANRIDVLVEVDHSKQQHIFILNDEKNVSRNIIIHGKNSSSINTFGGKGANVIDPFSLVRRTSAMHTLPPKGNHQILREFSVIMRGGDFNGGFPLSIYKGSLKNRTNITDVLQNETNYLYKVSNYTQLNQMKYLLHPFKAWKHNVTQNMITSRRKCNKCVHGKYNSSGIRQRPPIGEKYKIDYPGVEPNGTDNSCCWEWCDVQEYECDNYKLVQVEEYIPNKQFIPVCYGDRVKITILNAGTFKERDGHPMHLHGHDFVVRELGSVNSSGMLVIDDNITNGPLMDTIYVPYNKSVTFEFDAFNAGEHLLHCHKDLHLLNGMLTTVRYINDESYCEGSQALPTEFFGGDTPFPNTNNFK